ncbi:MAG: DUF2073 domain-containing protein [Methanosarcinales archaeon Met12]|nr:MAG: DUF2073 domain-containing protein [Methanosarcinales archaeon Met12]
MTEKVTKTEERTKRANGAVETGIRIDMLSKDHLSTMTSMEKIRLILDKVREGNILILEAGLTPDEEMKLMELTMTEIAPGDFAGIEIESYPSRRRSNIISKLLGRVVIETRLTVIGPANQIKTINKDHDVISALVSVRS